MRNKFIYGLVLLMSACAYAQPSSIQLTDNTSINLASKEQSAKLIQQEDDYTKRFSKFDFHSKTGMVDGEPTVQNYFDNAIKEVVEWSPKEQEQLKSIVKSVSNRIDKLGLKLNLPPVIDVIRTTGKEEGGAAGYTRGNYIVLAGPEISEELFIHELFHVYSRYNPEKREAIYNSIGFTKTNEIEYPKAFGELTIANPDAPINDYYITVNHNEKPVQAMMVIKATGEYKGGSFFQYLDVGLLLIKGEPGKTKAVIKDDNAVFLHYNEVGNLFEQIGRNTGYNIHPEEISASHFTMLLMEKEELPNPEIIKAMRDILSSK